LAAISAAVTVP